MYRHPVGRRRHAPDHPRNQLPNLRPRPRSPWLAAACIVIGGGLGGCVIYNATRTSPDLRDGARTQAVGTDSGKNRPRLPVIEVDGRRHVCTGGGNRDVAVGDWVRYDPADPSHCRLETDVGVLTGNDKLRIGYGVVIIVAFVLYGLWQPGRKPLA